MNKVHFENISRASADFVKRIDNLIPNELTDAAEDERYSDAVKKERQDSRRAAIAAAISNGAAAAKQQAVAEIEAMRAAFSKFMTTVSDPGALQTLQALLSTGVELSPAEIQVYASTGDYATLRILEPHGKGHVIAPRAEDFERDMRKPLDHYNMLAAYSGPSCELADAVTARPYGQSPRVAGAIIKGVIGSFPASLDEIGARWENVKEDRL